MSTTAIKGTSRIAGLVCVIFAMLAAPAAEAQTRNDRSFTLAGRQLLLIERMTNSVLLSALGVDASPHLRSIHWSRDRFDRMQTELRDGNPDIRLQPTTNPEILQTLDRADLEWRRYDSIFNDILKTEAITKSQVRALIASHAYTAEALKDMVRSYEYFVRGGVDHSILSATINGTGRLRANTQLALRGLVTVVYNDYAEQDRQFLAQVVQDFDQTLNGLIRGNPELRLIEAPTGEIRDELIKVELSWQKVRPILEAAAAGRPVEKDQIASVAQEANDMAVPLTEALIMYLSI